MKHLIRSEHEHQLALAGVRLRDNKLPVRLRGRDAKQRPAGEELRILRIGKQDRGPSLVNLGTVELPCAALCLRTPRPHVWSGHTNLRKKVLTAGLSRNRSGVAGPVRFSEPRRERVRHLRHRASSTSIRRRLGCMEQSAGVKRPRSGGDRDAR